MLNILDKNSTIVDIKSYNQNKVIYNLTVNNDHTYFVGSSGVLGHNAGCEPPGPKFWKHIFEGDIERGGRIIGYHHRMFGLDKGDFKVIKITQRGKGQYKGIYRGIVQYIDQNGVVHTKSSTFFPDN